MATAFLLVLPGQAVIGQDAAESLPNLQKKIIAAAAKAKPSVVRIIWRHDMLEDSGSGVIITADGYIVTFIYNSHGVPMPRYLAPMPPGQSVSVYLADGRNVPAVVVGSFLSAQNMQFDLVKITESGAWPYAETGRLEELKPNDTCFVLGYPRGPDRSHELEPSVRIGHLIPWGVSGMLRSSCVVYGLDDRGGGLFDLQGRLIGIHVFHGFSDYGTRTGPENCYVDVKVIEQNWRELAGKKPSTKSPIPGLSATTAEPSQDEILPPVPLPDAPELAAAAAKAREATVAFTGHDAPFGWSGTIVTPDGYIATCAHHHRARGTDTTVYFADGRTAPAKFLGRDDVLDIGLVKIMTPGPWPYLPMGKTTDMKAGDPCIITGYPNYLRKGGTVSLVIRVARIGDTQYAPKEILSSCQVWDGDSGGGLFDDKGRLIGALCGQASPRKLIAHAGAEGFTSIWDSLVNGPALGDPVPFDASPAAAAVRKAIDAIPPIVCEVLGDGKRRALGTIVSRDGYILTKASELYGDISCRLADSRVLPAAVRKVAHEHDLALLKIEATDLPQIVWSRRQEAPVGTLVASLRMGDPPTVGVVSYPTHKVAPAMGYLGIGKVKDADGGVEVEQFPNGWTDSLVEHPNHPIRLGDIILSIEGHHVPNVKALEQLASLHDVGWDIPFVIAGDPIHINVRRDGKELNLCFPLLSMMNWDVNGKTSLRNCSFPAVFDTDASLVKDLCGGPLVDCKGQVVGIMIAVPVSVVSGSPVMSRVFVIPAAVARNMADKFK